MSFARKSVYITARWMLLLALTVTMTGFLQVLHIRPVFADESGTSGYPWTSTNGANCVDGTGCSGSYNWGYTLSNGQCPSIDTNCLSYPYPSTQPYTAGMGDKWGYGVRNCTSYVAWKINQAFGVTNITGWGSAATWDGTSGHTQPYTVYPASGYTPQIGDIAQWKYVAGGFGHVAFVYAVNNGIASLYDYNEAGTGSFSYSNTTATSSEGTPNNYIHIGNFTAEWSGNSASSWGSNRLDAFGPEMWSSGVANIDHEWFNGSWQTWDSPLSIPSNQQVSSWPAAVSWGSNRIDLFARSNSNQLLHAYNDTSGWHGWETIGGSGTCISSAPGVSSWGANRLDVFALGCGSAKNQLQHIYYDGSWHSWDTPSVGSQAIVSAPGAVSWGSNRMDIFAQGSDNKSYQAYYDTSGWHNWTLIGDSSTCITGAPSVSSWGSGRLDVFAQGCDGGTNTYHDYYDGSWHTWQALPNSVTITTSPSAISWGSNRIDLFARNNVGHLIHRDYDGTSWSNWEDLSGTLGY